MIENIGANFAQKSNFMTRAINVFALAIIAVCVFTSFYMNFMGRALWCDESALAYSFSQRGLGNLTSKIFEIAQSAPIVYLYLVKIITVIFGNTEFNLRILSVISYMAVIFLVYLISRNCLKLRFPIVCAAYVANMTIMLEYSNMFKQYMFETAITLIVVYVYHLYTSGSLRWWIVSLIYAVAVWSANPSCFLIAAILLIDGIIRLKNKEYKKLLHIVLCGAIIFAGFIVYYFYWLKPVADDEGMQSVWEGFFMIIPTSVADLQKLAELMHNVFSAFRPYYLISLLIVAGLVVGIARKQITIIIIAVAFAIAFIASYFHQFIMVNRLWCFSYPLSTLAIFYFIDRFLDRNNKRIFLIAGSIVCILIFVNRGFLYYLKKKHIYRPMQETNFSFKYLEDNLKPGDIVLIPYYTNWSFKYKYGYNTDTLCGCKVLFADSYDLKQYETDTTLKKVYIPMKHDWRGHTKVYIEEFSQYGTIDTVFVKYDTPVLYFERH